MARAVKTCECDGVCGHEHNVSQCGVPEGGRILRSQKRPGQWLDVDRIKAVGEELDETLRYLAKMNENYVGASVVTGRLQYVGVRGVRVLMCTFCRHAWRARRAAEREEQRLARANRKPLYRRGVLR